MTTSGRKHVLSSHHMGECETEVDNSLVSYLADININSLEFWELPAFQFRHSGKLEEGIASGQSGYVQILKRATGFVHRAKNGPHSSTCFQLQNRQLSGTVQVKTQYIQIQFENHVYSVAIKGKLLTLEASKD